MDKITTLAKVRWKDKINRGCLGNSRGCGAFLDLLVEKNITKNVTAMEKKNVDNKNVNRKLNWKRLGHNFSVRRSREIQEIHNLLEPL